MRSETLKVFPVLCCKGLHELLKNAAIDESG